MTNRTARPLSEVAIEPRFPDIAGVSIRFAESERRDADAFRLEKPHVVAPDIGTSASLFAAAAPAHAHLFAVREEQ